MSLNEVRYSTWTAVNRLQEEKWEPIPYNLKHKMCNKLCYYKVTQSGFTQRKLPNI